MERILEVSGGGDAGGGVCGGGRCFSAGHRRVFFETVVIDTAPVLAVDDTPSLAPKADGTLIVYRAGRTSCRLMRNSLEALYSRNAKVLGVIFNGVDPKQPEYGYYKYTEYYYSKTVSRKKTGEGEGEKGVPEVASSAGDSPNKPAPLPPHPVPPVAPS